MVNTQVLRLESVSIVRLLHRTQTFLSREFQALCGVVEYASHPHVASGSKHAIVALAQGCSSQKYALVVNGTGLHVLRCCRLALVVTPVSYLGLYAKHALGEADAKLPVARPCF